MTAAETSGRRTAADAASGAEAGSDGLACPSRRALLRAAALAGVAMPLLAACGSGSPAANAGGGGASASGGPGSGSGSSGGGAPSSGGGGASGSAGSSSGAGASVLATTHQVPVGGGLILPQEAVVITQPKTGKFEGFSAICTHAGCPLVSVSGGTINCPCHGSQFSIKNGHVVTGPAIVPLPKRPVKVHGKNISLA